MALRVLGLLFIMIIGASPRTFAYVPKDGNVWAIAGPMLTRPEFRSRSDDGVSAPWMGGFGLLAIGDLNDKGSLELGLLWGNKIYLRETGPNSVEEQTQIMHATAGYRYWLNNRWSLTGSFYTGYAIGDPTVIRRVITSGPDYSTSARDTSESGLDLSLETELWQEDKYAVVLNGRYSYAYPAKEDEKSNQYGVLFGIRYFIQGRKKFEPEVKPTPAPTPVPTPAPKKKGASKSKVPLKVKKDRR